MKDKRIVHAAYIRVLWLAFAICLTVVCGPVKKLIEQKIQHTEITTSRASSVKKLRTWYRERRDIKAFTVSQSQDNTALDFFIISSALLFFALIGKPFTQKNVGSFILVSGIADSHRYLHLRKLLV